ncbi:hypothetical protein [Poritiphilus flavus]|uniref:YD repeat-containing protein n=1 Tax=Poritiphilus flavus TaxID=2697053 RepID=A0A6L9EGQ4_9FLAO|nr:hypothetical protein [Poritiphilus flavus]NAS13439.1 hypothetical protein [Poritiphilus flavus]
MIKNYSDTFCKILSISWLILGATLLRAQEPKIFSRADFDLKGRVKSCLVITDYGKEEFEFNEAGLLTKSVTRFNEKDYDVTYYKYQGDELIERRNENYRDGLFDKYTSIAHIYEIDTLENRKVTERILSYAKEFLDQYEYLYDEENRLVKITRSNNEGIDETKIEYTTYKDENTQSTYLNGSLLRSVRTSAKKKKGIDYKLVLTKDFIQGIPSKAVEALYDKEGKLISEQEFQYDESKKSFKPSSLINYSYNENGLLSATARTSGSLEERKEYIYQFDGGADGNWIKQIITPENSYTTRRIVYFEPLEAEVEE